MPNLSSLGAFTTQATALSNLILVSPQATIGYQPQNAPNANGSPSTAQQPPAFLFHYEGEQTVTIESDITDHFIEDNTALQDQISLKPVIVTTHGFIGELNDVTPKLLKALKFAADKLTVIGPYVPGLTETALLAYAEAFQLYQVASNAADAAVSAWNTVTGQGGETVIDGDSITPEDNQNKQQTAFQTFYGYWSERRLFTIQTPWAVFQNMVIKSLRAIQDAETNVITDFDVTFKIIRVAQNVTLSTSLNNVAQLSGQAATQASPLTDLGISSPTPSSTLAQGLTGMGVA